MRYAVRRRDEFTFSPVPDADGVTQAVLLSEEHGSVHLEIALVELAPGASSPGHLHPFEESFYVLSGRALVALDGTSYALETDAFGFAPIGVPHAWHNPHDEPMRCLRVRAPQPRVIGGVRGTYPAHDLQPPASGRVVDERDPRCRWVGQYTSADVGAPGPLSMPGYHGHNIRDISVRMMVDEILGAQHHTLFLVEFAPSDSPALAAKEHFHPFEEIYYLLQGQARGTLDGDEHDVAAGDLVWAGTNASHGYVNTGDVPVRWLEVQAPAPPPSDAFFFEDDWKALGRQSPSWTA